MILTFTTGFLCGLLLALVVATVAIAMEQYPDPWEKNDDTSHHRP